MLQVTYRHGGELHIVHSGLVRGDVGLVEVAWTGGKDQGKLVHVLVCGSQVLQLGYDRVTHERRPVDEAGLQALRETIAERYSLTDDVDAIAWACSSLGTRAFRRRVPASAPD